MSNLTNNVQLLGHVGQDPEIVNLDSGAQVAKLSIATTDRYKNKNGEQQTETQWHNIVAYNGVAKVIGDYVKKGSKIAIGGKLTHRSYEDKQGVKRYVTEVVCRDLELLSPAS